MTVGCTTGSGAAAAQARLVHCGSDTCLRVSGRRANAAVAVRIAGQNFVVEGIHAWRVTVPLRVARDWRRATDGTLPVSLSDAATGIETVDPAVPPPGALERRVELATLIVRAH
ncbi:hypothetical protein [uncultured Sphingomonas sp.]|uniref:hypothetical protein n=1 Tax=uncultured Sphingomonas sp. TaxID=158754 RepID=UPI00261906EE|nr:hypothetical protein [uncultured Sphingomonas sp.]